VRKQILHERASGQLFDAYETVEGGSN
jgi:hypothetical protein